ncbi:hypothetical protein AYO22_03038 [Fonsecaea multimorphosa]|nr:hypothetical protein AYO22_03038 [Fonsecaea multimorphosa]
MRLLKVDGQGELSLTQDLTEDIPSYAILSHTWATDKGHEVTFDDMKGNKSRNRQRKQGYTKIQLCGIQAQKDGQQYVWVDTCCIDKKASSELNEALISMFRWYQNAEECYVYLPDVSLDMNNGNHPTEEIWQSNFRNSRWFTRGWTLQELLAPKSVHFFSREWKLLGNKRTLEKLIHEITQIPIPALRRENLNSFSVCERLKWTVNRNTTREEDKAYCLLGIFDVYMPIMYGEGTNAFHLLKSEIHNRWRQSTDGEELPLALDTSRVVEEANVSIREPIERSRRGIDRSNRAVQSSQQESQTDRSEMSTLEIGVAHHLSALHGITFETFAFSVIVAVFDNCVQALRRARWSMVQMIGRTDQSMQALRETQSEMEAARRVVISECEHVEKAQTELKQRGSVERADDYSLSLLFGEGQDDPEDTTVYDTETHIGRGESRAAYTPVETISSQTEQTETQSDQSPPHSNHEAIDDEATEKELLRYRINALRSANKQLKRSIKQNRLELRERENQRRLQQQRIKEMARESERLRREEKEKRQSWGFCTIL